MMSYDVINSIDISGAQGTITQRGSNMRIDGNPFFGGVGRGAIRVTLNNIISKIGWDHLIRQPPRGGPTAYQN